MRENSEANKKSLLFMTITTQKLLLPSARSWQELHNPLAQQKYKKQLLHEEKKKL
jgi:hypothetical protein